MFSFSDENSMIYFIFFMLEIAIIFFSGNLEVLPNQNQKRYQLFVCCELGDFSFNTLSGNPTKWSNTLKQFDGCCRQIV